MKPALPICLLVTSILLAPQSVAAQFDAVTALFKEVESITLYGQSAWVDNAEPDGRSTCLAEEVLCGVGVEVLIDVASGRKSNIELGLGASYLGGLTVNTPGLEFRGALRSFPTVSAYYNGLPFLGFIKSGGIQSYVGASVGLTELYNAQTYDTARIEREVKASTFDYGLIKGFYADIFGLGFFAEASYRWRRFPSLDYTPVDADSGRIPRSWPHHLNLSGPSVAVGLQFRLKADPAPVPVQVWTLTEVDARELPAPIAATTAGNSVDQIQIVFGSLTLVPKDTSYVLEVVSRRVTVTADGVVESLPEDPQHRAERGKYVVTAGRWSLHPAARESAYGITRSGDDFTIRDLATGAMLTFRKPGAAAGSGGSESKKD